MSEKIFVFECSIYGGVELHIKHVDVHGAQTRLGHMIKYSNEWTLKEVIE